jgi:hypothetical protein
LEEQSRSYKALLNEYKGSLFEYLVGFEFAKKFRLEQEYIKESYQSYGHVLEQQESYIRNYYPHLLELLPVWSQQLVDEFLSEITIKKLSRIRMVGKQFAGRGDDGANEADILLIGENKTYPLSIKLAKDSSFVNTKSSGIKSFYKKNFEQNNLQDEFNQFYEQAFEEFAMEMHSEAGILYHKGFESWESEGYPSLPGKLSDEYRKILLKFYRTVNLKILEGLQKILKNDPEVFDSALRPLMGFSQDGLIQVTAFHKEQKKSDHSCRILIKRSPKNLELKDIKARDHSIDLELQEFILQLRLKPMNKFTASAYKINSSIKQL